MTRPISRETLIKWAPLLVLIALVIFFTVLNPTFFSARNFARIAIASAPALMVAVGVTFIIIMMGHRSSADECQIVDLADRSTECVRPFVGRSGRYSSLSSVLQQGLELLLQKTEAEPVETAALREVIQRRLTGPMISATEMEGRVAAMIERKRRTVRVDS